MLQETVEELNPLLTGINIFLSYIEPNVSLYFAPPLDFKKIAPEFVAANNLDGFYWVWWNENTIYEAKIIINCLTITQGRRSQLIRQLITRSLGFLSDSERYDKSIFHRKIRSYQDASLAVNVAHRITKFADIDYTLIKMLYSPNILHGQTENEVRKWLSQ